MKLIGKFHPWNNKSEFWNKIDEWTDNSQEGVGAEFHDSVSNHEEMYQECVRYQNWIHAATEPNNVSEDLVDVFLAFAKNPGRDEMKKLGGEYLLWSESPENPIFN